MHILRVKFKYLTIGLILLLIWPAITVAEYGDDLTMFPPQTCSMEFRDADVKNVLRSLVEPYKVNLLVSKDVKGTITASFDNVSIKNVFIAVLKDAGLDYVIEGDILRVDSFGSLEDKRKQAPLITRKLEVTYAFDSSTTKDLTNLAKELKKLLSGRAGSEISVIPRTNTLIITDIPDYVQKIVSMVRELDKESPQIAILAKIVTVDSDYSKELGINWNAKMGTGATGTKTDNLTVDGGVDLGATSFGNINLMLGRIDSDFLNVQLTAMENEGKGDILSSPKVITQNNQPAKIESGVEIPYQVQEENGGFKIEFKDAEVSLEVTPHVIGENVFLDMIIHKDAPGTLRAGMDAIPIDTNQLNTRVLVKNGETVVVGGLIEQSRNTSADSVPFLSKIPLLGWLFKFDSKKTEKSELIIFVTPTIIK
jgi:type IV pilus assembly protein PilQ